ncbi:MAG: aminopeptidase, partial [Pseudomonadota bacterium]
MADLTPPAGLVERLAELAVAFGANVREGQIVGVTAYLGGHEPLVHAIAEAAYRRGARFVDVNWFDPRVKRARIEHAADDTLDYVPPWYGGRWLALGDERGAYVAITGPTEPGILDDLDPARAGKDRLPSVKESLVVTNARTVNWTIVPFVTEAWARLVRPDVPVEEAYAVLWDEIAHVCRLDEDDPVAAWGARMDANERAATRLTELAFDTLRYRGPTIDLEVGLLPTSRWNHTRFATVDGHPHHPNVPSEEVFTSPDPTRAEGWVESTKPLVLADGSVIRGLRVRFEDGRAVEIEADEGGETLRTRVDVDEGGRRLGEVALVDREGRIGPLGTIFYDTLLDENAASHLALGAGFPWAVGDADEANVNESAVHVDFMIGSDEV